ncbi:MAG TPA: HEAT repeat domain-containing protein [Polyangiaceae bacterium]|nr:HEAT repeat domain-containing protein [Polyangiaceae bacterium]
MSEVDKIIRLLKDESIEKRIAAAIVLGELRVKKPEAIDGFVSLLDSGVPVLQRHALEALAHLGSAKKGVHQAFALLGSNVDEVRRAAQAAIRSIGDDVVPLIRKRMETAAAEERRALDAILADVGGKDAFSTLLAGLASSEGEAAKAAALAVRQHVKEAGARERRNYLAQTEKYLKSSKNASPSAVAAAIKILGYLEDESAVPTLLGYAKSKDQPPLLRQEALIALRFALQKGKANAKVTEALIDAAESPDRALAHAALHTLGTLPLPPTTIPRFEKLLAHEDLERARFAAVYLSGQKDERATKALVKALLNQDRRRAELVAETLTGREEAVGTLARALLDTKDPDRAWLLRKVLSPMAKKVSAPVRKQLLEAAKKRLASGERGWEAQFDVVQSADPAAVAETLRELAQKLQRGKNEEKAKTVLGLLLRSDKSTDDDRYALASIELRGSPRDTRPQTRAGDPSLSRLKHLVTKGYDVAAALRKDRSLELDHLYYVGFHFAEEGHTLGEDLLETVVKKGGKTKVAKAAKNKLALSS